ncbi:MAG: hypothetical protein ACTS2F_07485 [Thainema sp.]
MCDRTFQHPQFAIALSNTPNLRSHFPTRSTCDRTSPYLGEKLLLLMYC